MMEPKRVLVAYATKMGSTREIAEVIGEEFARAGFEADIRPVGEVADVRPYAAVVLGSALYMTRWRREAVRFLKRNAVALAERPTWLFHSGPLGEKDAKAPQPAPPNVRRWAGRIGLEEPTTFGGRLDEAHADGLIAKGMARKGLGGDFRDFDEIRGWARTRAERLAASGGERWVAS